MNRKIKVLACLIFGLCLTSSLSARSAYEYRKVLEGEKPCVWCGSYDGLNYELTFHSDLSFEYGIYSSRFPEVISAGENGFEAEKYNVVHAKGSYRVLNDGFISVCYKDISKSSSIRFNAPVYQDFVMEIKLIDDETAVLDNMLLERHYK